MRSASLVPGTLPLTKLERIKANVGDEVWGSLYQQRPRSAEGDIFNWAWWDGRNRYNIDDSRMRNKVIGTLAVLGHGAQG